jgi:hypothetical protein
MFPNDSLDNILANTFDSTTSGVVLYIGLKGPGDANPTDTLSSHSGWSEVTDYTGNRKVWNTGQVLNQEISNSANPAEFSINGDCTCAGIFITDVSTGTSGDLYEVEDFQSENPLESGDTLEVTHAVGNASSG